MDAAAPKPIIEFRRISHAFAKPGGVPLVVLADIDAAMRESDFLDLWIGHRLPLKTVLLVTHNIEEAVLLCDRILVLSSNPGRVCAEIAIPLAHPRDRLSAEFRAVVDEIYSILTLRSLESLRGHGQPPVGVASPLPRASVNQVSGLIETLLSAHYGGHAELSELARTLSLEVDDLFPIAEALHILGFAEFRDRSLKLTRAGRVFGGCVTDEREGHWAPILRFQAELEDHLTHREADRTLRAVIGWGRYAELFSYDAKSHRFLSGAQ